MKIDADDIMIVLGGCMVAAGIGFIYWPAALIAIGLVFIYLGLHGLRR